MSEVFDKKLPEIPAELQEELLERIAEWEPELRAILPNLAEDMQITFDNKWLIYDFGIGGFATDTDKIELAFDPAFRNKVQQLKNFKGSYFHECFHTVQTGGDRKRGFTRNAYEPDRRRTPLEMAILEGAATKFEMLRAKSSPGWGEYPTEVRDWVAEVAALPIDYDEGKWKFYDPETDRQWIMYRSGTYIVDQALKYSDKTIEDLANFSAMEIYTLSGLSKNE